jgi:hypothetical protein
MEKTIGKSPTKPIDVEETEIKETYIPVLDFPDAIREVIAGKKIHKREWKDKNYYGVKEKEFLMLHKPDGKLYQWIISEGDLLGEDWEVI